MHRTRLIHSLNKLSGTFICKYFYLGGVLTAYTAPPFLCCWDSLVGLILSTA